MIIAALRARGRTFGTLTLANAESGRLFDEADVQLAEELARRAGTAIDNARLYTERTRIAHTLQVKLLPERLPDIPGAVLAARYRAAGELNEVGGDFYDVFPRSRPSGRWSSATCPARAPEAAAITALARYTLRAGALDDDAPAKALRRLNTAMLAHDDDVAVRDRRPGLRLGRGRRPDQRAPVARRPPAARWSSAATGRSRAPGRFGDDARRSADDPVPRRRAPRSTRATCCCSTPTASPRPGRATDRSASTASSSCSARSAGESPQEVVDAVELAVVDAQEGQPRDDIALLALGLAD